MRAVYIAEDTDFDDDGDTWALGTFSGHVETGDGLGEEFEELPLDAALAWGRARAAAVYVRVGDGEYHSAGSEHPPDLPVWPPADLPRLVRRRSEHERWKDRTETDPPIAWAVTAWVAPADGSLPARRHDAAIRSVAERAGARLDREPLRRLRLRVVVVALRAALTRRSYSIIGSNAYRLRLEAAAPTAAQAQALASGRLDLPAGWEATFEVVPA